MNNAGASKTKMIVILNDNDMSIARPVGAMGTYLAKIFSGKIYFSLRETIKLITSAFSKRFSAKAGKAEDLLRSAVTGGTLFSSLGFYYIGPIDGHDLNILITALKHERTKTGPRILHVLTRKGKGYGPAEASPIRSHSMTKLEKKRNDITTYSDMFGQWACERAAVEPRLVAITPAMKEGSSLVKFAALYPQRFHDVAIAEQHAITLAAGLAAGNAKPVVAIYSTFLQRGYDQLIHDVAIQNLDVLLAIDRASLLEDGPTHSGVFDLSFARAIPNLVIMTPSDSHMLKAMLDFGFDYDGPAMVRYPRGAAEKFDSKAPPVLLGRANRIREGKSVAILVFGTLLGAARQVADEHDYTVVDMRFVKPMDKATIVNAANQHDLVVTLEENVQAAGALSLIHI